MKDILENIFGFIYTLSMGDYIFFIGTFLIIISFLYVLYLILKDEKNNTNEDINYLKDIKNTLENNYKPEYKNITQYEKEQESSAIISYEELINNKDKYNVSYDEEYTLNNDDVKVKKIKLDNTTSEKNNEKLEVKLLNYSEYEEFLVTLKQLQKNLIN